jgi:prepilin-type N-terminal cleavage/methylation domain-containing protein
MAYVSRKSEKGFTLIELSIVMVIIGLIVAGVVAGQSLVRQAQLRTVISEQEQIRVSLNSFNLEYNALPGDMSNASSYWSAAALGCSAAGVSTHDQAECDGDGNKKIIITASNTSEGYMVWKHLSLAGLYSGSFIPTTALLGTIGGNIPASKFSGAGITLIYDENTAPFATAGDGSTTAGNTRNTGRNVIIFGGTVAAKIANSTVFSAPQVNNIDIKVDDGSPTVGTVVSSGTTTEAAGTCLASATAYNLDSTDLAPCLIAFVL